MIDGHCHLDKGVGSLPGAMKVLYNVARDEGVEGIILLNLPKEGFDNEDIVKEAQRYNGFFRVFPSLNPKDRKVSMSLSHLKSAGAAGLKMHPRLHGYRVDSDESCALISQAGELGMPVMMDGFPDGKNLSLGNLPESFARLADNVPSARIAIGHAGGHRILDALMVAKYFKNLYLDLSFTLLYYRGSSVSSDISYVIDSMRGERIFWGSDYPDRSYTETVNLSRKEFKKMGLAGKKLTTVTVDNVRRFLGDIP